MNGVQIRVLNPDAKVYTYTELYKFPTLAAVFGGYQKVIILYLIQGAQSGHWVCLFFNKHGLSWFDSFGLPPDFELNYMLTPAKRKELNEDKNYLTMLLTAS